MVRHVIFRRFDAADAPTLQFVKNTARTLGLKVVQAIADTMLVEAEPSQVKRLVDVLPGWRHELERNTAEATAPEVERLDTRWLPDWYPIATQMTARMRARSDPLRWMVLSARAAHEFC